MADAHPELVLHRLREPHLPCIDVGTKHKPVWLPMELCTVVRGQALKRGEQPPAAEMLKMATKLPGAHRAAAEARVKASGFGADATLREFGLSVEGACMQVSLNVAWVAVRGPVLLRWTFEEIHNCI